MSALVRLGPARAGARRVVLSLCLVAAAACSAENDDGSGNPGDGAVNRSTDVLADTSTVDGQEPRIDGGPETGSADQRADIAADGNAADRSDDRLLDGPANIDQRNDVTDAGPADSGAPESDGSRDASVDAGSAADRTDDSAADRSPDTADARSDGGDAGARKPSGVFGGGPFYNDADTVMPAMRASGFSTMVLWSIHVRTNGDLVLNDVPLFANGSYVGSDAAWPGKVATLKTAPTSVTRVEFSVGAGGTTDFESIESLIGSQGTGPTSILYKNFSALKAAIPATDAIDFDDESNYDVASTVAFSVMLGDLGYKVTLCPYTNSTFWTSVFNQTNAQRPGLVDRVLLQVYAGGAGNNPVTWSGYFGGLQVEAGLWSRHAASCATGDTPSSVRTKMTNWRSGIGGGWMWLLDDMLTCESQYPIADYAAAINEALNP